MADQIEPQSTIVMKELSDIKEKLATNTEATKNNNLTLSKIENQLTDFAKSFVTHEEYKSYATISQDHEDRLRSLESKVWRAIGALVVCQIVILPVILYLFFKVIK